MERYGKEHRKILSQTTIKSNKERYWTRIDRENMSKVQLEGRKGTSRSSRGYQADRAWEEYWHERVPDGYVVHHVDRDIINNVIWNLALVTRGYHNTLHKKGVPLGKFK